MSRVELPPDLVKCEADACKSLNEVYRRAEVKDKEFLVQLVKQLRKNVRAPAEEVAEALGIGRSTLFYRLKKLNIKYEDVQNALVAEVEEAYRRKLERREIRRLPPKDKQEFFEREIVQKVITRMKGMNKSPGYISRVVGYWWRLTKRLGIAPEDFVEMDREKLHDLVVQYLSDRASEGVDINNEVRMIQTVQRWLGYPILPPGITQKEYKGKYQEAEIPLEIRNVVVSELLDYYDNTGNTLYLRTVQAMAFLYYTGSRRQALMNYQKGETVRVGLQPLIRAIGTDRFRIVSTLEKKGLYWRKLIPMTYDEIIPARAFSPSEVRAIAKLMKSLLMKYFDRYNKHTQLYLQKSKVYHIWRHTATRDYLKALGYNRYIVAKLLGWIKDSNLVIYGDYELLQLLQLAGEEHYIKFVDEPVYQRLLATIRRAGL
jgi:AcrR family transcriptional regulator